MIFRNPPAPRSFGRDKHGTPLPADLRRIAETLHGEDLSDVRIHTSAKVRELRALAYTSGADIHFAPGQYDPGSEAGLRLIGHEIAHVIQQRSGRVRNPNGRGVAVVRDPVLEAEADRMAEAFATRARRLARGLGVGYAQPVQLAAMNAKVDPSKFVTDNILPFLKEKRIVMGMVSAFSQQGGWEGWLQVELATYLADKWGGSVAVLREQLYSAHEDLRVDILVKAPGHDPLFIELKCQGVARKQAEFKNLVKKDIAKIAGLNGPTGVAMAITVTDEMRNYLFENTTDNDRSVRELAQTSVGTICAFYWCKS